MGLIAPVTLVGAAVMHVADVLAGLTMAQIIKPGAPVLFGGAPAAFHMKTTTAPMAAVEALRLNLAYVQVAKSLGLPTQAYMALSDSKFVDAQGGAETFASALLAAIAGINSVSGPGMLDYVLVFSLEKLVFDDELCGQALHFVRDVSSREDLPTVDLVRQLLQDQHLLVARHTLKHWPQEMYLPCPVFDRLNRDNWQKAGQLTLSQRLLAEVERHLAAYQPIETDPRADAEMRRLIQTGLVESDTLPKVPAAQSQAIAVKTSLRRPRPRREDGGWKTEDGR
jgi:trimethylamine--corrinoid protein Co-methyltransferase